MYQIQSLRSTDSPDFDKEAIKNALTELIKLKEMVNIKTPDGSDSPYMQFHEKINLQNNIKMIVTLTVFKITICFHLITLPLQRIP